MTVYETESESGLHLSAKISFLDALKYIRTESVENDKYLG